MRYSNIGHCITLIFWMSMCPPSGAIQMEYKMDLAPDPGLNHDTREVGGWIDVFAAGGGNEVDDEIRSMGKYNGLLITGGHLNEVGGMPVNHIASWNGQQWDSLGVGVDGSVTCLFEYDGLLIAGGYFSYAGGILAYRIAAWDGSSWLNIGNMDGTVHGLTEYEGKLIACGSFESVNGIYTGEIVSWDGNSWEAVGPGVGAIVVSLVVYEGELIAGGDFTRVGDNYDVEYIMKWTGDEWISLQFGGDGLDDYVEDLGTYGGNLIVGGVFSTAGGSQANLIAMWDGIRWSGMDGGLTGGGPGKKVQAFAIFDGALVVAGRFQFAGSIEVNNIANWNGSNWGALDSGTDSSVYALCSFETELYVGGRFDWTGNIQSSNIGVWSSQTVSVPEYKADKNPQLQLVSYPNPFNPNTVITISLRVQAEVSLRIHDLSGRLVRVLIPGIELAAGKHSVEWDGRDEFGERLPTGVYIPRLESNGRVVTAKLTLLK